MNVSYKSVAILLAPLVLGAAGCSQAPDGRSSMHAFAPDGRSSMHAFQATQSKMTIEGNAAGGGPAAASEPDQQARAAARPITVTPVADVEPDRYLIKNATLSLESPDVRAATGRVIADARARGGYVSDLHENVDSLDTRTATFVVRVPAARFDAFLQRFDAQGKMLERQVTAEDVTEEFVDTRSRLHNLRATEGRLLAHLDRTGKLSDTLLVEKEITRVREDVDRLTGRLKFLSHRVAFSTFNVTIHETPHIQAMTPSETFSAGRVLSDSTRSLVAFGQGLLVLGIWFAIWSVVWLPPLLFACWVHVRRRAEHARKV